MNRILRLYHVELELNSHSQIKGIGETTTFHFPGDRGVDWMKFQIKPYQTWFEFKFKFVEAWFQHFYILGAWGTNWVTPATPEADGLPSHNQTPSDTLCPPPTTGSPRASSLDILACLAPTQWHKSTKRLIRQTNSHPPLLSLQRGPSQLWPMPWDCGKTRARSIPYVFYNKLMLCHDFLWIVGLVFS